MSSGIFSAAAPFFPNKNKNMIPVIFLIIIEQLISILINLN